MDVIHYLERRLTFIRRFYELARPSFEANTKLADQNWEHWQHRLTDEEAQLTPDPPVELQDQCEEAHALCALLGYTCLGSLQQTLKECLKAIVWRSGRRRQFEKKLSKLRGGWLECYRTVFKEFGCDWEGGPVGFSDLEEIVLAWNAAKHEGDIASLDRWQDPGYARKFPMSRYLDEGDRFMDDRPATEQAHHQGPKRVVVTQEDFRFAIETVEKFVRWVEADTGNRW
jgi:hypothetical protein